MPIVLVHPHGTVNTGTHLLRDISLDLVEIACEEAANDLVHEGNSCLVIYGRHHGTQSAPLTSDRPYGKYGVRLRREPFDVVLGKQDLRLEAEVRHNERLTFFAELTGEGEIFYGK